MNVWPERNLNFPTFRTRVMWIFPIPREFSLSPALGCIILDGRRCDLALVLCGQGNVSRRDSALGALCGPPDSSSLQ